MNYFGIYNTSGDVKTALSEGTLNKPYVAIVGDEIDYDSQVNEIDYSQIPLTFEYLEDGDIAFLTDDKFMYQLNGGEWVTVSHDPESEDGTSLIISVSSGDTLALITKLENEGTVQFSGDPRFNAYGNIMSLVAADGDDFRELLDLNDVNFFNAHNAFHDEGLEIFAKPVVNAENVVFPATALTDGCYEYMFADCKELVLPPKSFPLADLSNIGDYDDAGPYILMFLGCTKLERIPQLPAYTSACTGMYKGMFAWYDDGEGVLPVLSGVPADCLPATTLAPNCYRAMFAGRGNLVTTPVLPAATLVDGCYSGMFEGCAKITGVTMLATSIEEDANPFGGCGESEGWVDNTGWYEGGDDKVLYVNPNSTIEFDVYPEDDSETECTPTMLPYRWTIENYTA